MKHGFLFYKRERGIKSSKILLRPQEQIKQPQTATFFAGVPQNYQKIKYQLLYNTEKKKH